MAVKNKSAMPARPVVLSADNRTLSYTSKNGQTVTFELRNGASSKAADSLRDVAVRDNRDPSTPTTQGDGDEGVVATIYDSLTFMVMEAVEIAVFGPYDETIG